MSGYYHYIGAAPLAPSPYYVLLATPASDHPECNHEKSMVATVETLVRAGIQFDFMMVQGSCHVDDVRNSIIRDFLQHRRPPSESEHCRYTYTDLFFLDADMGWDAKGIIDLLQAPGDIVAGVYRHKNDTETYPFDAGQFEGKPLDNGLFEMPKVATGFMRIRREVLQKLYDLEGVKGRISWANPQDRQKNPLGIARIVERGWPRELGIPEEIHAGNDYQSGDYMMCLKARRAGFRVFADPDMKFTHAGSKVWIGHFGNHIRTEQGVLRQELIDAVEALKTGDDSLETFVKLREGYSLDPSRDAASSFALTAEMMKELWDRARQAKAPVLEMGSGLSTLVLALALEGTGQTGHVLECELLSWRKTNAMLERFEAKNVTVYYTPLEPIGPRSNDVAYAETGQLPDAFGLVLVDGPYHSPQRSRAVWALRKCLRNACLLIDDVDTCDALMTMLDNTGHQIEIKEGARKWAIATPKTSVPAMPHTLPGKLIVSLTSHPPRFPMLKQALQSILDQDMKPDETVLWLARHEFAALPPEVLRMDGLTIRQCEDLRSYKKLIPALEAYPDAFVLTADDDLLYPRNWVRGIVEAWHDPKEILLYRGRQPGMIMAESVSLTPYITWPNVWRVSGVFPTSCHGMLVPPGAMPARVLDRSFTRLCPMNDDIWWWWMGSLGGSTFRTLGPADIRDLPTGQDGLWSQHNRDGGNDKQISAMIEAYGLPWAEIMHETNAKADGGILHEAAE